MMSLDGSSPLGRPWLALLAVSRMATVDAFLTQLRKSFFGYTVADLAEINPGWKEFCTARGYARKAANMYLFAEVLYLAKRRRKVNLEKATGVALKNVDPVVRHFILGDYLKDISTEKWKEQFYCARRRCLALGRVTEILQSCKRAHPKAVIDFCVENPRKVQRNLMN